MAEITQVISTIPAAGHRGVDTRDNFVTKQEAFQDHLTITTVGELNTYKTQVNLVAADINGKVDTLSPLVTNLDDIINVADNTYNILQAATTATTKASEASVSASSASSSATNALASEVKSEKWADEDEGVEVEPGKYSAKHWALQVTTILGDINSAVDSINGEVI